MKIGLKQIPMSNDQFFTDPALAARIVKWAKIPPGSKILEPSAGGGSFVNAVLELVPDCHVTAVEIDSVLAGKLERKLAKVPEYNGRWAVIDTDFLDQKPRFGERDSKTFEVALLNPPYGSRKAGTVGLAARHVAHTLLFAKRSIALVVSGFEHGVGHARTMFDDNLVAKKVVLVRRPVFHGPDHVGGTARRDHIVLDVRPRLPENIGVPCSDMVETERWEIE